MTGDSNHPEPSGESISGSIDQACDRFEAAWREGQRPRIEQYWGGFSGAARTELFVELLLMELELRRRAGEQPQLEEYRGRFPEYDQQIEAMLGEESTRNIRGGGGKVYRDLPTTAATLQYDGAGAGSEAPEGAPVGQERFRRIRFHRRGGLGEIWLAQDRELSRRVALKELREVHREKVEHRLRFLAEAKITGALEHPGVVPVYACGQRADQRPYYVMRFIRGESLDEAIESFHRSKSGRISRSKRILELRGLLGRFTSVCNTIHFAHSHDVIHRDLKPTNIMLGKHGETLVVDWGLAKLLDEEDAGGAPDDTLTGATCQWSPRASDVRTQMGSVLGTLQYMSPEQAAGSPRAASPAADIYSLGATLYCLLTSSPPQSGTDSALTLEKVQRNEFPRPREVAPEVPPALEAICLRAMALEPSDRYATAQDMASDMERWLADEPVSVYHESSWERLARWIRRRSGWIQAFVLALVVLAVTSLVAALLINRARQGESAARRLATQESVKSKEISKFLLSLFKASDPLGLAGGTWTSFRSDKFDPDIKARALLERGVRRLEDELADQPETRALLLDQIGGVYRTLGLFDNAVDLHHRALRIRREILPADHPDVAASMHNLAWALCWKGEHAEAGDLLREVLEIRREHPGEQMADLTASMQLLAILLTVTHQYDEAEPLYKEVIAMQREQFGDDHQAVAIALSGLAAMYLDKGDDDQAETHMIEAYTIFCSQEGYSERGRALGQYQQAITAIADGRYAEAEEMLRYVVSASREMLGDSHPYIAWELYEYGGALTKLGRFEEARQALLEAEQIAAAFIREDHTKLANVRYRLAATYTSLQEYDEAALLLQKVLKARERTFGRDSDAVRYTLESLGEVYRLQGDLDRAIETHREALDVARGAFAEDPEGLSDQLGELAKCCLEKGEPEEAELACRDVLAFQQRQGVDRTQIGKTLATLGHVLLESGNLDGAEQTLKQSLEAVSQTPEPAPATTASIKSHLGACLARQRRFEEAESLLLDAHEMLQNANGQQDAQTLSAIEGLIELYEAWDKPNEAEEYRQLKDDAAP